MVFLPSDSLFLPCPTKIKGVKHGSNYNNRDDMWHVDLHLPQTKGLTMILADALLNAKKYIHEPKYHDKERAWGYERRDHGQWVTYFTITEEACWEAFYKQFRVIKESLMAGNERSK